MRILACSLALLLLTTAVELAYSGKCNNEMITCLKTSSGTCPRIPSAGYCCSRKLVQCGNCMVCLKYLGINDVCESFAPTNAVCKPPLLCGGSVCILPDKTARSAEIDLNNK